MNVIFWTLRSCLGLCRHTNLIRERRPLHGVNVLHLVCEDCGHAVPALQRTATEHQEVVAAGAIKLSHARRAVASVVALDLRRNQRRAS